MKVARLEVKDVYQDCPLYRIVESEYIESIENIRSNQIVLLDSLTSGETLVKTLNEFKTTIAVAESLTGGLLSAKIVKVSGASNVFDCGVVSYSNDSKVGRLGVKSITLKEYGAVSYQTALEMAKGVKNNNTYSLSTTGIAGPNGDGVCNKIGVVFIGLSTPKETRAYGFKLDGDRESIRNQTVELALSILYTTLLTEKF